MIKFGLIPVWVWWLIIGALVAVIGVQEIRISYGQVELANFKKEASDAARVAGDKARTESERRQKVFDDEAASARVEKATLEADVSRLADVADGLRDDLASFQRRDKQNPKAPIGGKSQSSEGASNLLAGLYLGSVQTNRDLARFAEELWRAGSACERIGDKVAMP